MELAIVLGVVAVVLAGVWSVAENARERVRQDNAYSLVLFTVNNLRSVYQSRFSLAQVSPTSGVLATDDAALTNRLILEGVVSPDAIRNRAAAVLEADHPWGPNDPTGALIAGPGGSFALAAAPDVQTLRIRLRRLAPPACTALAMRFTGGNSPTGLLRVDIDNNGGVGGTVMSPTVPLNTANIMGWCAPAGNNAGVPLDLYYSLRAPS